MAIITEHPYIGNENLIRHYSDANKTVIQVETGNEYAEAIDIYPTKFTYIEGNQIEEEVEYEEG